MTYWRSALKDYRWIFLSIALLSLIIYFRGLSGQFVSYDDPEILLSNTVVHDFDLKKMFFSLNSDDYIPITLLTYAIEFSFTGLKPFLYHFTNLVFHILNSGLVFLLALQLSGRKKFFAAFVALMFAVHPLHVESVAWVTERKDVLFMFFFVLSWLSYLRYLEKGPKKSFWKAWNLQLCFFFFVLSLFSKTMAVTLPISLLVFDLFCGKRKFSTTILEKIPFIAFSLLVVFLRVKAEDTKGGMYDYGQYSLLEAFFHAGKSVEFYVAKIFLPLHLSAVYEPATFEFSAGDHLAFILALGFFALTLFKMKSERPGILFGLGFFLVTLFPVLQIVPFGNNIAFADRYAYLPSFGLFYSVGVIGEGYLESLKWVGTSQTKTKGAPQGIFAQRYMMAMTVLVLLWFSWLSFDRVPVWASTTTLWEDVVAKFPTSIVGNTNMGNVRVLEGKPELALQHYRRALQSDPYHITTYLDIGEVYYITGHFKEALIEFQRAEALGPSEPQVHLKLAKAYSKLGETKSAHAEAAKTLELDPTVGEAQDILKASQ